jgi:hypothetical protein
MEPPQPPGEPSQKGTGTDSALNIDTPQDHRNH